MSKSLAPDQTDICHKYVHVVKGIDFLMGYAVACSSSHAWVQECFLGKLQVCKVLGGRGIQHFPGGPNFYENLYNF